MIRIKRFLLMLVIAFAVPAQGMAALSAGVCMAADHHDAPGQVSDQVHAPVGAVPADAGDGDGDPGGAHCGGAGSIASLPAPAAPILPAPAVEPRYADGVARALPDRLDRPPLSLS